MLAEERVVDLDWMLAAQQRKVAYSTRSSWKSAVGHKESTHSVGEVPSSMVDVDWGVRVVTEGCDGVCGGLVDTRRWRGEKVLGVRVCLYI